MGLFMRRSYIFGAEDLSHNKIKQLLKKGKKIDIRVFGFLRVAKDVNIEDLDTVVNTCRVYGVISAPPHLKKILRAKKPFSNSKHENQSSQDEDVD
ncbi:MAG: hypothetical protein ACFFAJ_06880 [Candidatus Hodarchaeota archaeon]